MENEIRQRNINSHSHQITLLNSELFLILSFIFKESSIQDKKFHIFQWNLRTTLDFGPNYLDILLLFDLSCFHSWQYNRPMDYSWYGLALIFYLLHFESAHRAMWSVTNYFLVNLTIADLMMSIFNCIPSFIFMRDRSDNCLSEGSPDSRQLIELNIYFHRRNKRISFLCELPLVEWVTNWSH